MASTSHLGHYPSVFYVRVKYVKYARVRPGVGHSMPDGDETLHTRGFMYVPCAHQVSWPSGTAAPTPDLTLAYFVYVSQGAKYVKVRSRVGATVPDGHETWCA